LEAASGVQPTVIGKPGTAMMEQALSSMSAEPATTAILGDRLETDMLAGQRAGLRKILVLSGVTDEAILSGSDLRPDLVFDDVAHLRATWEGVLGD
jgi:ribonucleotide monophosphatase NagD (HAD superfamily)